MIRQYGAQRFRQIGRHRVGTVPVGTVVYLQDGVSPFRRKEFPVRRNPWMVVAWLNREYHSYGSTSYMAGGHLALVRSLRDGRVLQVADWLILKCQEDC